MSNPEPEHRDADFRVQTFGGRMRWLASILALAGLGLFAYLLTEGRNARLDFPFQIKGQAALWTVGIAFAIWFAIAVLNWMAWSKKK
jgi:hypothetical protein